MIIRKIDADAGKAVIELDRQVIGQISQLMYDAKCTGAVRAHFFLLRELLQHGAFDEFALEMGHDILTGEVLKKYGNNEAEEEHDGYLY